MKKLLFAIISLSAFCGIAHSQQIDPSWQIDFSIPILNAGPISQFYNGTIQADQFPGGDMCVKLQAANNLAIANGSGYVDATHFTGTQACSVNPFAVTTVSGTAIPGGLAVKFGNVLVQTAVQWHIVNGGISISSPGPMQFRLEYTGSGTVASVLSWDGTTSGGNGMIGNLYGGIYVYGDASNATEAVVIENVNRSSFDHLYAWGASGTSNAQCGIHLKGDVSNHYNDMQVSGTTFGLLNPGGSHATPHDGICLDKSFVTTYQTTNSTFDVPVAENVNAIGIHFISAQGNTTVSGTAEENVIGLQMDSASFNKANILTDLDVEGNSGTSAGCDVLDDGGGNFYIAPVTGSETCGGNAQFTAGGSGGQYILGESLIVGSVTGSFMILGNNSILGSNGGTYLNGTTTIVALDTPIVTSVSGAPSFTPGTGITSVTCADPVTSGVGCTASRGTLKVINSSATTTSSFLQLTFASVLATKPVCSVTQIQGANFLGLYVSGLSTSAFDIANANTLSGTTTFYISYECQL